MKNLTLILAVFFAVAFLAGCTLDYNPAEDELHTMPQEKVTEEATEKEALVPLLFEDEENELYLYGIKPEGIILYSEGKGHFYNLKHTNTDDHQAKIFKGHLDGDYNKEDLAVVLFDPTDDNNAEDLIFISDGNYDTESIYEVSRTEINSYASYIVDCYFENNMVTFTSGSISYSFDLSESFKKLVFDKVSFKDNIQYEFKDGIIYANIIPTASSADEYNDYGKINLDITIRAKLNFDGYNISLSSPELIPHI